MIIHEWLHTFMLTHAYVCAHIHILKMNPMSMAVSESSCMIFYPYLLLRHIYSQPCMALQLEQRDRTEAHIYIYITWPCS